MMTELSNEQPGAVGLAAINEVGYESSTDVMAELGDIPLLQDTADANVWGSWAAVYRDVVIVDAKGKRVGVYNLTMNDLGEPANYATLKQMLTDSIGP
jgi:hypothetical protein